MVSDAVRLILEGESLGRTTMNPSIDRLPGDGYREIAQVIAQIADAPQRQIANEKLATKWLAKQPEAARVWIEGSAFPREVKERLLRSPSGKR